MSFSLSSSLSVAGACALLSLASSARADAPASAAPAPSTSSAAAGTDLVRLRDGSMIRGTISELTVGGDVVVLTLTGETRRVAMSDVEYAGPASGAAAEGAHPSAERAPKGAPPVMGAPAATDGAQAGGQVPVKVVASEKDVTVHVRSGSSRGLIYGPYGAARLDIEDYQPLCVAPCRASLPRGTQTLAASLPDHRIIKAEAAVNVDGPATLEATYTSRRDTRTTAFIFAAGGYAVALAAPIVILSTKEQCDIHASNFDACIKDDSAMTNAFVAAGIGAAIGTVALVVALLSKDTVAFTLTPYAAPAAAGASSEKASSPRTSLRLTRSGVGIAF